MNSRLNKKVGILVLAGIAAITGLGALNRLRAADSLPFIVTERGSVKPAAVQLALEKSASKDDVVVSQKGRSFFPAQVTVKAHHRISITNDDDTTHHVFCSTESFKYTSGPMPGGAKVSITFQRPGTYEIRCAIHPQMLLIVVVTGTAN
jgi:plastocyanin